MRNNNHLEYIHSLYAINTKIDLNVDDKGIKEVIRKNGNEASFDDACLDDKQIKGLKRLKQAITTFERLKNIEYSDASEIYDSLLFKYDQSIAQLKKSFENQKERLLLEEENKRKSEYDYAISCVNSPDISEIKKGIDILKKLGPTYLDANIILKDLQAKLKALQSKKRTKMAIIVGVPAVIIAGILFVVLIVIPKQKYNQAKSYMENGEYEKAQTILETMKDYEDSSELYVQCSDAIIYREALDSFNKGDYQSAKSSFETISSYQDSIEMANKSEAQIQINNAKSCASQKKYDEAIDSLKAAREKGYSEYDQIIDETLLSVSEQALQSDDPDSSEKAAELIKDHSIVSSDLTDRIAAALAEKREREEKAAQQKLIEESYQELIKSGVTYKNVSHVEELFEIIPDDYKDISTYRKIYEFYKPYIGTYSVEGYGLTDYFQLTNLHGDVDYWVALIGDRSSGGIFEYPNLSRVYTDKYKGTWTISGNTVTHVYTGARTFTTIYRKQ